MIQRIVLVAVAIGLAAIALWHPAPSPGIAAVSAASAAPLRVRVRSPRSSRRQATAPALVYVVGAVAKPGLYRLAADARVDDAVRAAGGLVAGADPAAVDLAAFVRDGDEVLVPLTGQPPAHRPRVRRSARSRVASTPPVALDINAADAPSLAPVPGIGRAIAARIVEMRDRDGPFASLDELLDVAGMTQTRLERARPYLLPP